MFLIEKLFDATVITPIVEIDLKRQAILDVAASNAVPFGSRLKRIFAIAGFDGAETIDSTVEYALPNRIVRWTA